MAPVTGALDDSCDVPVGAVRQGWRPREVDAPATEPRVGRCVPGKKNEGPVARALVAVSVWSLLGLLPSAGSWPAPG